MVVSEQSFCKWVSFYQPVPVRFSQWLALAVGKDKKIPSAWAWNSELRGEHLFCSDDGVINGLVGERLVKIQERGRHAAD